MEPWKKWGFIAASYSGDCLRTPRKGIKSFVVHILEARSLGGHVALWARGLAEARSLMEARSLWARGLAEARGLMEARGLVKARSLMEARGLRSTWLCS